MFHIALILVCLQVAAVLQSGKLTKMNKNFANNLAVSKKSSTFALAFEKKVWYDSLAQLVEHNTFNVGVMGSSPMRITRRISVTKSSFLFIPYFGFVAYET